MLIVVASYVFYGWWDWRFLSLIVFSTITDYTIGLLLRSEENQLRRKIFLSASVLVNLGLLGFFKYYNFFLDNFIAAFSFFDQEIQGNSLNIILPVGISFYTFQTMSYTIDVYHRKLEPTKDLIAFSAFVSFFPQLVAGPIERATHLLPQFYRKRTFDYSNAVDGMRQILWGLFKKLVIADNCAGFANHIFTNSADLNGSTLVLGVLFFSFQIYGDFSGYSDIAIGTSRLFGFNLNQNFAFPYFSRDVAEFWRRWHVSLSSWFRDYLYIPLGGSRGSRWMKVRNTFIVFIVSGFWHGANWTFIIWGALHAIYFLPLVLTNSHRNNTEVVAKGNFFPHINEFFSMVLTFCLIGFAWIFFRAENITQALEYITGIFSQSLFNMPIIIERFDFVIITFFLIIFIFIEWMGRHKKFPLEKVDLDCLPLLRWSFYISIFTISLLLSGSEQDFIYFQF